jgi:hypothetical protein
VLYHSSFTSPIYVPGIGPVWIAKPKFNSLLDNRLNVE